MVVTSSPVPQVLVVEKIAPTKVRPGPRPMTRPPRRQRRIGSPTRSRISFGDRERRPQEIGHCFRPAKTMAGLAIRDQIEGEHIHLNVYE